MLIVFAMGCRRDSKGGIVLHCGSLVWVRPAHHAGQRVHVLPRRIEDLVLLLHWPRVVDDAL